MEAAVVTAPGPQRSFLPNRGWYRYAFRLLPPRAEAGRWVDFGCGRGEFLLAAAEHTGRGFGLDYSEPNAFSVNGVGHPALVGDLNCALPFRTASLDGATLVEVIEHIVKAEELVEDLARVIKPGGWLIVTTPNVAHVRYRMRAVLGHPPKQEGYHYRFFTRKTFTQLFGERGFVLRGKASYGNSFLRTRLGRLAGRGAKYKCRVPVIPALESLRATHFVWRLQRAAGAGGAG